VNTQLGFRCLTVCPQSAIGHRAVINRLRNKDLRLLKQDTFISYTPLFDGVASILAKHSQIAQQTLSVHF
jgi:hypothetical protein